MESPDQPQEESDLTITKSSGNGNRRMRKRRTRIAKETMYAIELHRRQLRQRLMIAIGVIVGLAATTAILVWYPGTQHFRNRFDRMIADTTGARVAINNAAFTAFEGRADALEMKWPEGGFLHELHAERITANVSPQRHFGRLYGGDEMRANSATLRLRYPTSGAPDRYTDGQAGKSRIAFDRIGVSQLDVEFGTPEDASYAMLKDTEVAFYPDGINGAPRALLYSGLLELPGWPAFHMDRGIIDFTPNAVRITSLNFRDISPDAQQEFLTGEAQITGDFLPDSEQPSMLQLKLESFQIQSLIGEEAGKIFVGRVDTAPGESSGGILLSRNDGINIRADLVANPQSQLTFNHFPFLAFLARAIDDRWFQNPIFEDSPSLTWSRAGSVMRFDDINFVARNRMAIRGSITLSGEGEIEGQLEVGLSPIVIDAAIARRLDGMFSPLRDEFRWVRLILGGTTNIPTDNFNAQFIEAPLPEIQIPQPPILEPEEESVPDAEPAKQPTRPSPPTVLPLLDLDED